MPEGKLLCAKNRGYIKSYLSNGSKPIYIKKANRELAEKLAGKLYLTALNEDLETEIRKIELQEKMTTDRAHKMLSIDSNYNELVRSFLRKMDQSSRRIDDSYESNASYPEDLIHKTISGIMVRSKSEAMIADALTMAKIPFQYERKLTLEDVTIYPDFTFPEPLGGKYLYWEHFGLMDDPTYMENAYKKLTSLGRAGIIPGINMLITTETSDKPFDGVMAHDVIRQATK